MSMNGDFQSLLLQKFQYLQYDICELHGTELDALRIENTNLKDRLQNMESQMESLMQFLQASDPNFGSTVELGSSWSSTAVSILLQRRNPAEKMHNDTEKVSEEQCEKEKMQCDQEVFEEEEEYEYRFEILKIWETLLKGLRMLEVDKLGPARDHQARLKISRLIDEDGAEGGVLREDGFLGFLVHRPNSVKHMTWEIIGMLLVIYDMITIPFLLAFRTEGAGNIEALNIVLLIYWSTDLISRFFLGFYRNGLLVMKIRQTVFTYLKGRFAFDLLLLCLDIFSFLQGGSERAMRAARVLNLAKLTKVLRALRSLRILQMKKYQEEVLALIDSSGAEWILILLKFAGLMAIILMVTHILACLWWAIGDSSLDKEHTWVMHNHMELRDTWYQYLTSLHWALTQFTPASMEVVPENMYERFFAICVVFFGMIIFSSCISSITQSLVQLRNYNGAERRREEQLRRFFRDHRISYGLTQQVWNFLHTQKIVRRLRVMEDSVELLKLVPDVLRLEMHTELYVPFLIRHPFFVELAVREPTSLQFICSIAIKQATVLTGQEFFGKGSVAEDMIFVSSGSMVYSLLHIQADVETPKIGLASYHAHVESLHDGSHRVEAGAWISEAGLWIPEWVRCGWLVCINSAELLQINYLRFHDYFTIHSVKSCLAVCRYGAFYNSLACERGVWKHGGITDLPVEIDVLDEMAKKAFGNVHSLEGFKVQKHHGISVNQLLARDLDQAESMISNSLSRVGNLL